MLDEIEEFVTGVRRGLETERVLTTIVFTDIVGSTERAAALGDEHWRDLLDLHDKVVRRELARFRGREVNTAGDGFVATFTSPSVAIDCAQAIVDSVDEIGLAVRVGIHAGEVEVRGNDIAGLAVHIGARVAAHAGSGKCWSHPRCVRSSPDRVAHSPTAASTNSKAFRAVGGFTRRFGILLLSVSDSAPQVLPSRIVTATLRAFTDRMVDVLSGLNRRVERSGDRKLVDDVFDQCLVATLSTVIEGQPWSVPLFVARDGDRLPVHGSTGQEPCGTLPRALRWLSAPTFSMTLSSPSGSSITPPTTDPR